MSHNDISDVRNQLSLKGFVPIPCHGKIPAAKGWNSIAWPKQIEPSGKGSTFEKLARWEKRYPTAWTTGVRVENGLLVIDGDCDDKLAMAAVFDAIRRIAPEILKSAPTRFGGGEFKQAIFCQLEGEDFVRVGSRKYVRPGDPDTKYHHIEIFGGKPLRTGVCSRQFAIYGPRSYAEDDVTVESFYEWASDMPMLHEVELAALPKLSKVQALEILDAFEAYAESAGWKPKAGGHEGDGSGEDVFDIDRDETRFDVWHGDSQVTYTELESLVFTAAELRVSPEFIPNETTDRPDRCTVFWSDRFGCAVVKDWKDNSRHYPKDLAGIDMDAFASTLKAFAAARGLEPPQPTVNWRANYQTLGAVPQPRPDDGAELDEKTKWLLNQYGYCDAAYTVVDLFAPYDDCQIAVKAFQMKFRAWREDLNADDEDTDTKKWVYATGAWEVSHDRIDIQGVRMRPDKEYPLYVEGGLLYKNYYLQPQHTGVGDIEPFLRFMNRFIPAGVEREWMFDSMAHKQMRPDIPGTAVLLVADSDDDVVREGKFGTGRGLFFRIAHKLYGERYARSQNFNVLDGSSSQSVYNDWQHGSILVTVDEAKTSATSHRRAERNAVYETLKDIVDPAPKRGSFKAKYGKMFDGMSYATYWVATNHVNAISIPKSDRRFTVLRNGRSMTPAESREIAEWMEVPGNIAALSQFLASRDLSSFNVYLPLETAGKAEMADLALSPIQEELVELMNDDERGVVFIRSHLEQEVEYALSGSRSKSMPGNYWRAQMEGHWSEYCVLLKTDAGSPIRIRVGGKLKKLYCFRTRLAHARKLTESMRRHHAAKWGPIDTLKELLEVVPKKRAGGVHDDDE